MWPAKVQDQFPAIKQIELKFLLSHVVTLNLATDFNTQREVRGKLLCCRKKKTLATRCSKISEEVA